MWNITQAHRACWKCGKSTKEDMYIWWFYLPGDDSNIPRGVGLCGDCIPHREDKETFVKEILDNVNENLFIVAKQPDEIY